MILVFGGTTEGRRAVGVLELADKPYYYSTRGDEQEVELVQGRRLTGGMTQEEVIAFCRDNAIRLMVDAAHPFADALHHNLLAVSQQLHIPLVRYDRIYPPHTSDIVWCRDYDEAIARMEQQHIDRLLVLTGVQTISKLRRYWQQHVCWCRILERESSRQLAARQQFPEEQLVYYEHDDLPTLLTTLRPQAILTKESGLSGGFEEKVAAAREAGVKVFVVERPAYEPHSLTNIVNGPFGLRRAIERLLPDFFPMKSGLTTGTCATAAVKAALLSLQGEAEESVWVQLPNGESVLVDIDHVSLGEASVVKDFSDDPDVTRGCRITAHVELRSPRDAESTADPSPIRFLQGEGVGRVTLPGLGIEVGEPAINPVPRQMMTAVVRELTDAPVDITLSVENGRDIALRTFNERVGVVDGISIIGSSGVVMPFSNEAFVESIRRELQVARAMGSDAIGLASGKRGEEALKSAEPNLRVIHYGNFIGAALSAAHELGFRRAVLGIMIGKAVKLAEGHLDTHSHKVLMNKDFLTSVAHEAGVLDADEKVASITMARELWNLMPNAFFDNLHAHCLHHCRPLFPSGALDIRIIRD